MSNKRAVWVAILGMFFFAPNREAANAQSVEENWGVVLNKGTVNNFPPDRRRLAVGFILKDSWEALAALGARYDDPPEEDDEILELLPDFWVNGGPQSKKRALSWVRHHWKVIQQIATLEKEPFWVGELHSRRPIDGYDSYAFEGWFTPIFGRNGFPVQKSDFRAVVQVATDGLQARWSWVSSPGTDTDIVVNNP
jgi:hypothetical protein